MVGCVRRVLLVHRRNWCGLACLRLGIRRVLGGVRLRFEDSLALARKYVFREAVGGRCTACQAFCEGAR